MMKATHNATLKEVPERFEIIGVNLTAHVLALTVADGFMREVL